jgi:hypothetical protein
MRRVWLWPAFAALAIVTVAASWWLLRGGPPPATEATYNVVPLTSEPGFERNPSFSPDGSLIAFEWDQGTGQPHIFVKVTGAGDPVRLTTSPSAEYAPVWWHEPLHRVCPPGECEHNERLGDPRGGWRGTQSRGVSGRAHPGDGLGLAVATPPSGLDAR